METHDTHCIVSDANSSYQLYFIASSILDVEIEGSFSVSPGDMCERVSYLAVVINRGDSDQVDESTWGNVANDIKYIPWRFHCEGKGIPIYLYITNANFELFMQFYS